MHANARGESLTHAESECTEIIARACIRNDDGDDDHPRDWPRKLPGIKSDRARRPSLIMRYSRHNQGGKENVSRKHGEMDEEMYVDSPEFGVHRDERVSSAKYYFKDDS